MYLSAWELNTSPNGLRRSNQETPDSEEGGCPGPHCMRASRRIMYAAADAGVKPVPASLTELAGRKKHVRVFGRMTMGRVPNMGRHDGKTQLHVMPAFGAAWSANHASRRVRGASSRCARSGDWIFGNLHRSAFSGLFRPHRTGFPLHRIILRSAARASIVRILCPSCDQGA
ncbi:hypothetical protein OI25_7771 [Paraburkholderia fungorum]|uniref:Uncharacterized protein n=1 Tax=Paraburkholderia fungorum TaxID=134537 RepID=A0AAU8STH1_9BURK|nr:hypothetical protein OI25_7771 [Paraburkholderia fungorum]